MLIMNSGPYMLIMNSGPQYSRHLQNITKKYINNCCYHFFVFLSFFLTACFFIWYCLFVFSYWSKSLFLNSILSICWFYHRGLCSFCLKNVSRLPKFTYFSHPYTEMVWYCYILYFCFFICLLIVIILIIFSYMHVCSCI